LFRIFGRGILAAVSDKRLTKYGWRVLIATFIAPFAVGVLFFACAGDWTILRGWLFVAVSLVGMFGGTVVAAVVDPELMNQRGAWKKAKGTKWWDKIIIQVFGILGFYGVAVVAGLDFADRWSYLGIPWCITGVVLYLAGAALFTWAMAVNRYFEVTVRIQADRGQQVVTTGPYRVVRHPGYVGSILWIVSSPLILGSGYALIPAGIAVAAIILRIVLEERTLKNGLPGYTEYTQQTKYRLLPGIW
jgi:protein-S-isoprenylcysteine O-methyltransferase Ste14